MSNETPKKKSPARDPEKSMAFFDHIDELRTRAIRMAYVFVAGFIGGYFLSDPVMAWLREPLFAVLPPEKQYLYFTNLFENFLTHLKIAGYLSIFVLSPYFFWEIWGFVAPGLKYRERRLVVPFVTAATVFFVGGALFSYYVLFPVGFKFFVTYGMPSDMPMLTIDAYYSTALKLMMLFGLGFELPVILSFLGALGIVDAPFLRAQRKNAVIGITIVSALFAPPDAVSMLLLMCPLIVLYESAIWVVSWLGSKRVPPPDEVELAKDSPEKGIVGRSDYGSDY